MAFFVQVCATALGLLIALGIDQWKTERAHRQLVVQTCESIRRELTANHAELRQEMASVESSSADLRFYLRLVKAYQKGPIPKDSPLREEAKKPHPFSWHIATLQSASWDAALANQALTYMEISRVEAFSKAFTIQRDLRSLRDQVIGKTGSLSKVEHLMDLDAPAALTATELRDLASGLNDFIVLFASSRGSVMDLQSAYEVAFQATRDLDKPFIPQTPAPKG